MSSDFIAHDVTLVKDDTLGSLKVTRIMPEFGAYIEGVDLCGDLDETTRKSLKDAWLQYGVIFFRNQQKLSPERQLEIAAIFGKVDSGSPHVEKLSAQVDVITIDERRPPLTNLWHSDNSTMPNPSIGTMIQIQVCPEIGGNTAWACTRKAYDSLSDDMKSYLAQKIAIHYWDNRGDSPENYLSNVDFDKYFSKIKSYPPKENPVILRHPLTGRRSIYVSETYTKYIDGMHTYESKAILQFLYSWIRMPEFYLSHHWTENDVAIWDNFTMQHYALADYSALRVNQRVTFSAE